MKPEQFRLAKDFETNMILAQPHTDGNTKNPVNSFHATVEGGIRESNINRSCLFTQAFPFQLPSGNGPELAGRLQSRQGEVQRSW